MQTRNRNTFTTIHTEGALLPVDLLQRISDNDRSLEGLDPVSYHLAPGEKINEAINRSWNRLNGLWGAFQNIARAAGTERCRDDPDPRALAAAAVSGAGFRAAEHCQGGGDRRANPIPSRTAGRMCRCTWWAAGWSWINAPQARRARHASARTACCRNT